MDEETIEVVRSEDGNVAPPEQTTESTPSEPTEPVVPETTTPETAPELFELPDGRKVDAETLSREWKENFYPDYTRKSQALKQKEQENINNKPDEVDPEWEPQSYEELLKVAEERAVKAIEAKTQAQIQAQQELENAVITQLEEVKTADPNVNENALFLHATKYGFKDLKLAHQNMKDMSEMAKKVQTTTAANIAKRSDPVSVTPGASGAKLDPSQFETARDYLKALKGNM